MIRIVALLLSALLMIPTPAHAGSGMSDATAHPEMRDPIVRKPGNTHTELHIKIEGPSDIWGMRKFAREINPQLGGVHVFRYGTCAQRPNAVCVKVEVGNYGPTGWQGRAIVFPNSSYDRVLRLNTYYKYGRYQIAVHEFTHALGIAHHKEKGAVGTTPVKHLSLNELRLLRKTYPPLS